MQPLSLDDRSHRVAETRSKSEDIMNLANKLVADSTPHTNSTTSLRKKSTITINNESDTEDGSIGGADSRHQHRSAQSPSGGGQVATLEEMRKKLEELDSLRQQLSTSNDKRHRIAILQDEVVAAENRVVDLVTALEAVTIKLAGVQDDVEDLHEKELAAKYDLELVERNLPDLVQQVEGLTDEEDAIRKRLNEAQDALDRSRQVADDTEASMQKILKGTMFDIEGGVSKSPPPPPQSSSSSKGKDGSLTESSSKTTKRKTSSSSSLLSKSKRRQSSSTNIQGEGDDDVDPLDKIKKEKWNLKADFLDTDQQRMELKLEKDAALKQETARQSNNTTDNNNQEDDDLARTFHGHNDVNILLGKIEEAAPNYYSHKATELRKKKKKNDAATKTTSSSSSTATATTTPSSHSKKKKKSSLKQPEEVEVPTINVAEMDTSASSSSDENSGVTSPTTTTALVNNPTPSTAHSSTRTSRDATMVDGSPRGVAFTFGTAGSRMGSMSSTPRGRSPTELSTTSTAVPHRIGGATAPSSTTDMASRKMSLGVAQHTVSRLTEKVAMLERTLERREKRMKDVEAANVATQDRFTKMRVELLMLRRGLALLGTVEEEGGQQQQLSASDAEISQVDVIAKLQEMAGNKEKRLTASYKLADNLSSTFLTGMDCEERAMMNEDVTVDIGPSQSSPSSSKRKSISGSKASSSSSALSQKGGGKSTVHKNSSQYRLLEDLRAEIRFYEAERITLYSRLYGLKENGGMVPAPHVSSVLKPATMTLNALFGAGGGGSKKKVSNDEDISTYGGSLLPPVVPIYLDSLTGEVSVRNVTTATGPNGRDGSSLSKGTPSALASAVKVRRTPPTGRTTMSSIQTEVEGELHAAAAPGGQLHQQVVIDKLRTQLRQSDERFQTLRSRYHSTLQILELVEQEALYGCDSYAQGKSNIEEKISAVIGAATRSQKELLERTAASDDAAKRATEELQHVKKQNEALTQTGKILRDELSTTKFRLEDAQKLAANLTTQLKNETRKFPAEELGPLDMVIKRARERDALPNGNAQALQQRLGYTCGDHLLELQQARAVDFCIDKLIEQDEAHDAAQIKLKSDSMSFAEFDIFRKDIAKKRDTRKRNTSKRQCTYSELSSPVGNVVLQGKVQSSIVALANTVRGVYKEYVLCNPGASTALLTAVQNIGTLVEFWEQLPASIAQGMRQYTEGVHEAMLEEFKDIVEMVTRNGQLDKEAAVSACEMDYRSRLAGKIKTDNQGCQTDNMINEDMPICEIIPFNPEGEELVNGGAGSSSRLGASQSRKQQSSKSMSRNSLSTTARRSSSLHATGSRSGKGPPSFKKAANSVMKKNTSSMSPSPPKNTNNTSSSSMLSPNGGAADASPIATIPSASNLLSPLPTNTGNTGQRDPFEDASYFDSDEEELYRSHRSINPNDVVDIGVGTDMTLEELECVIAGCEAYQYYQDSQQGMVDKSNNTTLSIAPDEAEFEIEQKKLEKKVDELKIHLVEMIAQSKQFKHESEANRVARVQGEGALSEREFELVVAKEELSTLRLANGSVNDVLKSFQQKDLQIEELRGRIECILDGGSIGGSYGVGGETIEMLISTISTQHSQISQLKEQVALIGSIGTRVGAASGFRIGSASTSNNTRNVPPRPATGGRPSTPLFPCDLPLRNVHSREGGGARRTLYRPSSSSATSRIGNDSESIRPSTASLMLHQNDSSPTPTEEQLFLQSHRETSPDDPSNNNNINYLEIEENEDPAVLSSSTLVIVDANTLGVEELLSPEDNKDDEGNDNDDDTHVPPSRKASLSLSSSAVNRNGNTNDMHRHNSMPTSTSNKTALPRRGSYDAGAGVSRVSLLPQQRTSFRKAAVPLNPTASPANINDEDSKDSSIEAAVQLMRSTSPSGSIAAAGGPPTLEEIEMVKSFSFHNANYQHNNTNNNSFTNTDYSAVLTGDGSRRSSMPQSSHQLLPRKRSQVATDITTSTVSKAQLPPLLRSGSLRSGGIPGDGARNVPTSTNPSPAPGIGSFSSVTSPSNNNLISFNPNFSSRSLSPENTSTLVGSSSASSKMVGGGPSSSAVFSSAITSAAHHKPQPQTVVSSTTEIKKQSSGSAINFAARKSSITRPSTTATTYHPPMTASAQAASVSLLQRHTSSSAGSGGGVSRGRLTVSRPRVSITPQLVASPSSSQHIIPTIHTDSTHARRASPKTASALNEAARNISPVVGGGKPYSRPLVPEPLSPRQGFTLLRETNVSDRPV